MEGSITLPEGVRRMVVYALEIRTFDDETFRFLRKDIPARSIGGDPEEDLE